MVCGGGNTLLMFPQVRYILEASRTLFQHAALELYIQTVSLRRERKTFAVQDADISRLSRQQGVRRAVSL